MFLKKNRGKVINPQQEQNDGNRTEPKCLNSLAFRLVKDELSQHNNSNGKDAYQAQVSLGIHGDSCLLAYDEVQSLLAISVKNNRNLQKNSMDYEEIILFTRSSSINLAIPYSKLKGSNNITSQDSEIFRITHLDFVRGGLYLVAATSLGLIYVWQLNIEVGGLNPKLIYIWDVSSTTFDLGGKENVPNLHLFGAYNITSLCTANTSRDIYVAYTVDQYEARPGRNSQKLVSRYVGVSAFRLSDGFRRELYIPPPGLFNTPIIHITDNPWHPRTILITHKSGHTIILDGTQALASYLTYLDDISGESKKANDPIDPTLNMVSKFLTSESSRTGTKEDKLLSTAFSSAVSSGIAREYIDNSLEVNGFSDIPVVGTTSAYKNSIMHMVDVTKISSNSDTLLNDISFDSSTAWLDEFQFCLAHKGNMHLFTIKKGKSLGSLLKFNNDSLLKPLSSFISMEYPNIGYIHSLSSFKAIEEDMNESSSVHNVYALCKSGLLRVSTDGANIEIHQLAYSADDYSMKSAIVIDESVLFIDLANISRINIVPTLTPNSLKGILVLKKETPKAIEYENNLILPADLKLASLPPVLFSFIGVPADSLNWEFQKLLNAIGSYGIPKVYGKTDIEQIMCNKSPYLLQNASHIPNGQVGKESMFVTFHADYKLYFWKLHSDSSKYFYVDLKEELKAFNGNQKNEFSHIDSKDITFDESLVSFAVKDKNKTLTIKIFDWVTEKEFSSKLTDNSPAYEAPNNNISDKDSISEVSISDVDDIFAQLDDVVDSVLNESKKSTSESSIAKVEEALPIFEENPKPKPPQLPSRNKALSGSVQGKAAPPSLPKRGAIAKRVAASVENSSTNIKLTNASVGSRSTNIVDNNATDNHHLPPYKEFPNSNTADVGNSNNDTNQRTKLAPKQNGTAVLTQLNLPSSGNPLSGNYAPSVSVMFVPAKDAGTSSIEPEFNSKGEIHLIDMRSGILAALWGCPQANGSDGAVVTLVKYQEVIPHAVSISLPNSFKIKDVKNIKIVNSFLCNIITCRAYTNSKSHGKPKPRITICLQLNNGDIYTVCEPLNGVDLDYGCCFSSKLEDSALQPIDILVYPAGEYDIILSVSKGTLHGFSIHNSESPPLSSDYGYFEQASPDKCNISDTVIFYISSDLEREVLSVSRLGPTTAALLCTDEIQVWSIELCTCGNKRSCCGDILKPKFTLVWRQRASILSYAFPTPHIVRGGNIGIHIGPLSFTNLILQQDNELFNNESKNLSNMISNKIKSSITQSPDIDSLDRIKLLGTLNQPHNTKSNPIQSINSLAESQRDVHGKLFAGIQERGEMLSQLREATMITANKSKQFADMAKKLAKS